jgi:hypothetical protein
VLTVITSGSDPDGRTEQASYRLPLDEGCLRCYRS